MPHHSVGWALAWRGEPDQRALGCRERGAEETKREIHDYVPNIMDACRVKHVAQWGIPERVVEIASDDQFLGVSSGLCIGRPVDPRDQRAERAHTEQRR